MSAFYNGRNQWVSGGLTAILHHIVAEVTKFLKANTDTISRLAKMYNLTDSITYIRNKTYGKTFKSLKELAQEMETISKAQPKTLYEAYYYTSSNELSGFLDAVIG